MICRLCKQETKQKSRFYFCCQSCYAQHRERIRHQNRRKNKPNKLKLDTWFTSLLLHGFQCRFCNKTEVTIDHIVSFHFGGTNKLSNIQPLCESHHRTKTRIEQLLDAQTTKKKADGLRKKEKYQEMFSPIYS